MSKIDTQLAWVDTETSGLEPDKDRIIEIAIVVTDGDLNEIETFEQKIRLSPTDRLAASPKALEVNGYNDADWAEAPLPSKEIWERVYQLTNRRLLAGQNVTQFDAKFIAAEMMRFGIRPGWDRRMADTMEDSIRIMYALGVRHPKGYPTAGLEFVYDALGGPSMPAHRAMADVRRAMFVYKYFNDAFRAALLMRDSFGITLQVPMLVNQRPNVNGEIVKDGRFVGEVSFLSPAAYAAQQSRASSTPDMPAASSVGYDANGMPTSG